MADLLVLYNQSTPFDVVAIPRKRRKVHHKVKTGCKACKVRRQKCDEREPLCSGCARYSTDCTYYVRNRQHQKPPSVGTESMHTVVAIPSAPYRNLPPTPSAELNFVDLELMHQYITSTCIATTQKPEITAHIQMAIPRLAQAYSFVMHGILAMAATHLSRLRPSRQTHYAIVAARNHDAAIPDFRSAMNNINEDNCHALITYAKSILWCSFASNESPGAAHFQPRNGRSWLPQWFHLLRGSCHLVESSRAWIRDGPHVLQKLDDASDCPGAASTRQIAMLMSEMMSRTESWLCEPVITALGESFKRASMHHHNTPARNGMNYWVERLPDEYMSLLHDKEPWALVVLAHFCVLVQQSETVWFMKGNAERLLLSIVEMLNHRWRQYVRWPSEQLGIGIDG